MRTLIRTVATTVVVLMILLGATGHADAKQKGGNGPRATFMRNCEESGGTLSRIDADDVHTSACTWLNGKNIDTLSCDFIGSYIWTCTFGSRQDSHYD